MGAKKLKISGVLLVVLMIVSISYIVLASFDSAIVLDAPADGSVLARSNTVDFNFSANFTDVTSANVTLWTNLTGTFAPGHPDNHTIFNESYNFSEDNNGFLNNFTNITLLFGDVEHNIIFNFEINWTNGSTEYFSYGLNNASNSTFTYDRASPGAFLMNNVTNGTTYYENGSTANVQVLTLGFNQTSDLSFQNYTWWIYNDTIFNETFLIFNGSTTTIGDEFLNMTVLNGNLSQDGRFYYFLTAYDQFGSTNATVDGNDYVAEVIVDAIDPEFSLAYPTNATWFTTSDLTFNLTYHEAVGQACDFYLSGPTGSRTTFGLNFTNKTGDGLNNDVGDNSTFPVGDVFLVTVGLENTTLSNESIEGGYLWDVSCNDTQANGNMVFSTNGNFTFFIDTESPTGFNVGNLTFNATNTTNNQLAFNWTQTVDTNFINYTFRIYNSTTFAPDNLHYTAVIGENGTGGLGGEVGNNSANLSILGFTLADFTYYWQVTAYDAANEGVNLTGDQGVPYEQFTIDTTGPNITLHLDIENSTTTNDTLDINVSVDDSLDVQSVLFNITNGTENIVYVPTNDKENFYNLTINISEFVLDALHNLTIIVNDSLGNERTQIQTFTRDGTGPSVSVTCDPATTTKGASAPVCTCSPTDISGIASQTFTTRSVDTDETGTITVACSATDTAGNVGSGSGTYTVTQPSAAASTGGGGGSTARTTTQSNEIGKNSRLFGTVQAGQRLEMPVSHNNIAVTNVKVTSDKAASLASVVVASLSSKPSVLDVPMGVIHQYLEINTKNLPEISDAVITFTVPSTWLTQNSVDENAVTLLRWTEDKWVSLETTLLRKETGKLVYEAKTPEFSYFAISGASGTLKESGTESTSPSLSESATESAETRSTSDVPEISEKSGNSSTIVVVIIVLVVLGGLWWFFGKKK